MATQINGAKVTEQVYEFGITGPLGTVIPCPTYEVAKHLGELNDKPIKMRAHYVTEWMDAK